MFGCDSCASSMEYTRSSISLQTIAMNYYASPTCVRSVLSVRCRFWAHVFSLNSSMRRFHAMWEQLQFPSPNRGAEQAFGTCNWGDVVETRLLAQPSPAIMVHSPAISMSHRATLKHSQQSRDGFWSRQGSAYQTDRSLSSHF